MHDTALLTAVAARSRTTLTNNARHRLFLVRCTAQFVYSIHLIEQIGQDPGDGGVGASEERIVLCCRVGVALLVAERIGVHSPNAPPKT